MTGGSNLEEEDEGGVAESHFEDARGVLRTPRTPMTGVG